MKLSLNKTHRASPAGLSQLRLNGINQARYDALVKSSTGDAPWRLRMAAEARELLALEQTAYDRMRVLDIRAVGELCAMIALRTPVALRPVDGEQLRVAPEAVIGLKYPAEAIRKALPGYAFVSLLSPTDAWYGNVSQPHQAVCLGASIPAGTRCRHLVMMTYAALSGQTVQTVDPMSGPGVMNLEAAMYWQRNLARLPLTDEPFLSTLPEDLRGEA